MSILNHNTPKVNTLGMSKAKAMYNMISKSGNPQAMFNNIVNQNPQMKQVLDLCKTTNPKDAFYKLCKEKGINPDDILNQLK